MTKVLTVWRKGIANNSPTGFGPPRDRDDQDLCHARAAARLSWDTLGGMLSRGRSVRESCRAAVAVLKGWTARQLAVAVAASATLALLIGLSTVLIPNPVFGREIGTIWWNYPVWLLGSVLAGMLMATYVRPDVQSDTPVETDTPDESDAPADRASRLGMAGGILTWFAVGCPVCNKIALLALGYSGALTWFAPAQPFLAVAAIGLTGYALVQRLANQLACPVPS